MLVKHTTMGRFTPKFPELDQQILEWFMEQREQGLTWLVPKLETTPLCQLLRKNNTHSKFPPSFLLQKGMDGQVRREGVGSPVFAENP